MRAAQIFLALTQSTPIPTSDLPPAFGIYALWDHERSIRYFGCTPRAREDFRIRVANKHVTGSEGRSHKFSQAYCVGRMWRYSPKLHPECAGDGQDPNDAKLAKRLRTLFIRRHCAVTFVEVPVSSVTTGYFAYLTSLEAEIQARAPDAMRAWEGLLFVPTCDEPVALVEGLLNENTHLRAAAERQNALYLKHVCKMGREIAADQHDVDPLRHALGHCDPRIAESI